MTESLSDGILYTGISGKNEERMRQMKVTATVDRPPGSVHPSHPDIVCTVSFVEKYFDSNAVITDDA